MNYLGGHLLSGVELPFLFDMNQYDGLNDCSVTVHIYVLH